MMLASGHVTTCVFVHAHLSIAKKRPSAGRALLFAPRVASPPGVRGPAFGKSPVCKRRWERPQQTDSEQRPRTRKLPPRAKRRRKRGRQTARRAAARLNGAAVAPGNRRLAGTSPRQPKTSTSGAHTSKLTSTNALGSSFRWNQRLRLFLTLGGKGTIRGRGNAPGTLDRSTPPLHNILHTALQPSTYRARVRSPRACNAL